MSIITHFYGANSGYSFYLYESILPLKKSWERIVNPDSGKVFLTYQYNLFCGKLFRLHSILSKGRMLRFCVMKKSGKVLIIFPCIIDKKQKKLFFLTEQYSTGAGYNDLIYCNEIEEKDLNMFWEFLKKSFPDYVISLHDICEKSIIKNKEKERCCVRISISKDNDDKNNAYSIYDIWYNSMSKNSRQNLRTAYNRLETDSKSVELKKYGLGCSHQVNTEELYRIYLLIKKRSNQINDIADYPQKNKIIGYVKNRIMMFFAITCYMVKHSKRAEAVSLEIGGELAACMVTYQEENEIVVSKLATDSDFFRYSPGYIMLSEYIKSLPDKERLIIDMSRGEENYKVVLGGKKYYNYSYEKDLSK